MLHLATKADETRGLPVVGCIHQLQLLHVELVLALHGCCMLCFQLLGSLSFFSLPPLQDLDKLAVQTIALYAIPEM